MGCVCPEGTQQVNDACFETADVNLVTTLYPLSSATEVNYKSIVGENGESLVGSVQSAVFTQFFLSAAVECQVNADATGCQVLGNLCVLTLYDEESAACELYRDIADSRPSFSNAIRDWPEGMPWLYFDSGTAVENELVELQLSFDEASEESNGSIFATLRFVLGKYAMDGTWLGFEDLTDQLQLCPNDPERAVSYLQFGNSYLNECNFNLHNVIDGDETVFYDPWLVTPSEMVPVKVRVKNLEVSGSRINENDETLDDVFTRRFFVYDNLSGREESTTSEPQVIRVASKITMRILLSTLTAGRIVPPLLDIEYTERYTRLVETTVDPPMTEYETAEETTAGTPKVSFEVQYTMNTDSMMSLITTFFGVFLAIVAATTFLKMAFWTRREQSPPLDMAYLWRFIVIACGTLADIMFVYLAGISFYFYLFFKAQDTVAILMPTEDVARPFYSLLIACLVCKTIHLADLVLRQVRVDLFFIDWEKSRGRLEGKGNEDGEYAPVSAWRSLLVANEYNELQTIRQVNFEFTLVFLLFVMTGLNGIYYASNTPNSDLQPVDTHFVLRFALIVFFLYIVVAVQLFWNKVIYRPYFEDTIAQFVDLLSMANVSCFILDGRYTGYYLHGRSVHPHADANFAELRKCLQDEENNLVGERGLVQNDKLQTYEIFLHSNVRDEFDLVYMSHANKQSQLANAGARTASIGRPGRQKPASEELYEGYQRINKFLIEFITRVQLEAHSGFIRDRTTPEKIVGWPPDAATVKQSLFIKDYNHSWRKVLFHGIEWHLLLFNVLLLTVLDIALRNVFVAGAVTYIVELIVRWLRSSYGEANISRSTATDRRFLI